MTRREIIAGLVSAVIIILDQLAKVLMSGVTNRINIIPTLLTFTPTTNTGAAFGIFNGYNTLLLFLSIAIVGFILYNFDKLPKSRLSYAAAGLVIGGAIGNIIDRIRLGYVIDFIYIGFWPAFNVADAAVTVGAVILAVNLARKK